MRVMKVVINSCYGGFGLSDQAMQILKDRKGNTIDLFYFNDNRDDSDLIEVVERLGYTANDDFSKLKVVEIPDGVNYTIEEYDGLEHIAEIHRTWY
jgi:hypothetical protein